MGKALNGSAGIKKEGAKVTPLSSNRGDTDV
jgi:hypothetical protein